MDWKINFNLFLGHDEIVKILIENDADLNIENVYGKTPTDIAEDKGNIYIDKFI